jgi:2-polyprenyl-3-methyl-5-hydroxy-6-metoxy-1,4-benzoquinol methylase
MKEYYRNFVNSIDLKGNEKVLDFGCGPGAASKFIALTLEKGEGELTCFDISEKWIKRARKNLRQFSNVEYYAEDIRKWEEKKDYYETVVIHFMLHDILKSERPDFIRALVKKMKVGATLLIREPTKQKHGMPPEEIKELMMANSLKETTSRTTKRRFMGTLYTGLYTKTSENV